MTDAEKRRLEVIVGQTQDNDNDTKDNNAIEPTLFVVNEFLPDNSQARQLDEINQQLRRLSNRLFLLSHHYSSDRNERNGESDEISSEMDTNTVQAHTVFSIATTVDEVMTKNFEQTLKTFHDSEKRLVEIDAELERLRQEEDDNKNKGLLREQLDRLIMTGLAEDFEVVLKSESKVA